MTWSRRTTLLLLALGLLLGAAPAAAQPFEIEVMVSRLGQAEGRIDPKAAKLHGALHDFRYGSLEVLETKRLRLQENELGTLALPNGKPLRVRPLQLTDRGLLVATQVGDIQTDVKLRSSGHLVVIDAGPYRGDRLVVSFEGSW